MDGNSIQQLLRGEAFDHPAGDIVLRETHISWVILCGEFAYKIKKPVNFGFLDFSTLALRRHFCEEEVRLNRRFAPALYLAVVPITQGQQGLQIAGAGDAIEYAVKMRRFREDQLLSNMAERGELDAQLVRALALELARLHGQLPICHPDPAGSKAGTPAVLKAAMEDNFHQLRRYPLAPADLRQLETVEHWARRGFSDLLQKIQQRVTEGRVIDGHGDVHLGNIGVVDGAVTLFDCIEFNALFRIMDTVGEIAMLTMDLHVRGHPEAAHTLLTDYLEYRGDYAGLALLDQYRSYFALVRSKVSLLSEPVDHPKLATTGAYREMRSYLELAAGYCRPRQGFVAVTLGVSGSGKTTIAGKLLAASAAVRIRSDVERKRLFDLAPEQRSRPEQERLLYCEETTQNTLDSLEQAATDILGAGFPVIIDATCLRQSTRTRFRDLATHWQVPFVILYCTAPLDVLRERLAQREKEGSDASEAGVAVMQDQLSALEPLSEDELALSLEVDSSTASEDLWRRFQALLEV